MVHCVCSINDATFNICETRKRSAQARVSVCVCVMLCGVLLFYIRRSCACTIYAEIHFYYEFIAWDACVCVCAVSVSVRVYTWDVGFEVSATENRKLLTFYLAAPRTTLKCIIFQPCQVSGIFLCNGRSVAPSQCSCGCGVFASILVWLKRICMADRQIIFFLSMHSLAHFISCINLLFDLY